MVLIKLSPLEDGYWKLEGELKVTSYEGAWSDGPGPGMEPCVFLAPHSAPASEHEEVSLQLWDVTVSGLCCGPEVAAWLGTFLGGGAEVRLLQHAQDGATRRRARGKYLKTYPRTFPVTCVPGFADVTPYMLTTQVMDK